MDTPISPPRRSSRPRRQPSRAWRGIASLLVVACVALGAEWIAAQRALEARSSSENGVSALVGNPTTIGNLLSHLANPPDRSVDGRIVDAETNAAIANATINLGGQVIKSSQAGAFRLYRAYRDERVAVVAEGYLSTTFDVEAGGERTIALEPRRVEVSVRDTVTGGPIPDAVVTVGADSLTTDLAGAATLRAIGPEVRFIARAPGYTDAEATARSTTVEVRLRPNALRGQVVDARNRQPVPNARVTLDNRTVQADQFGGYTFTDTPEAGSLSAWAPGYRTAQATLTPTARQDIEIEPRSIKGIYLSPNALADRAMVARVIQWRRTTELNAVVIDIKAADGRLLFPLPNTLASALNLHDDRARIGLADAIRELRDADIYIIARIIAFHDDALARARPDWAIQQRDTTDVWLDPGGSGWADPFRADVWRYNIEIAVAVADAGVDEILFDELRFPSQGSLDDAELAQLNTPEARVAAIGDFLTAARAALTGRPVALSMTVFGFATVRDDDLGVGVRLESLASRVDVISPMLYPSTFGGGVPGVVNPVAQPYDLVFRATDAATRRLRQSSTFVRPWLQAFPDYAFDRRPFGPREIGAQIQGAEAAGATGWLLWDATGEYAPGAWAPRSSR